jgi:hypothetical protein
VSRLAIAMLWLALMPPTCPAATAEAEIEYLLDFVASSGCTFIRNGSEHDSADAADHLRLKYRRGRRYADSAEGFIDNLASESSWTGRPYRVVCDGEAESSRAWLYRSLERYRAAD